MDNSKIWIVDDDPIDSYVIKTMLEINELTDDVQIFSNNEEVIKELSEDNELYNSIVIITENKTKFVNGWSIIKKLRKKLSKVNIRFHMTSESFTDKDIEEFKKTDSLLSLNKKPLRLDDLKKMVES